MLLCNPSPAASTRPRGIVVVDDVNHNPCPMHLLLALASASADPQLLKTVLCWQPVCLLPMQAGSNLH
jgi:hypothetical protein